MLRAVVEVSTLGAPATFQAVVDTGGPITVIASDLLDSGGDPVATGTTMMLRLGGSTSEVMLYGRFPGVVWSPCSIRGRCRARRYCLARRDSSIPVRSRSALMASRWNRPPPSAGGSHRSSRDDLAGAVRGSLETSLLLPLLLLSRWNAWNWVDCMDGRTR